MSKAVLCAAGALGLALMISVAAYLVQTPRLERRLLSFPDTAGGEPHFEWHNVPAARSLESRVRVFVEELMLGPVGLGAVPFIPESTELQSVVLLNNNDVVIDFSAGIMFNRGDADNNVEEIRLVLVDNLRRNFARLGSIHVTVDGQLPGEPRFGEIDR